MPLKVTSPYRAANNGIVADVLARLYGAPGKGSKEQERAGRCRGAPAALTVQVAEDTVA